MQQRTPQRQVRPVTRDREKVDAVQQVPQRPGDRRVVVLADEAGQGHLVPARHRLEQVPGAQLVAFARRERQAAGEGEDAGPQCFFQRRVGLDASSAGSDSNAAALSTTKLPAVGSNGTRDASFGSTSAVTAPR